MEGKLKILVGIIAGVACISGFLSWAYNKQSQKKSSFLIINDCQETNLFTLDPRTGEPRRIYDCKIE